MIDIRNVDCMDLMKEFFPFSEFKNIGLFTKEMKGDYKAQAKLKVKGRCQ